MRDRALEDPSARVGALSRRQEEIAMILVRLLRPTVLLLLVLLSTMPLSAAASRAADPAPSATPTSPKPKRAAPLPARPVPAAGQPTPAPALTAPGERFEALLHLLHDADSVVVTRVTTRRRPMEPRPAAPPGAENDVRGSAPDRSAARPDSMRPAPAKRGPEIPSESRPGRAWAERVAAALRSGSFSPDLRCRLSGSRGDGPNPVLVLVRAYRGDRQILAEVRFAQRCVTVGDPALGYGSIDLAAAAGPLLDLVREALPQDSVLQHLVLPPATPQPGPPPAVNDKIVVAPPTDGARPAFGEYVYVEELPEAVEKVQPPPRDYPGAIVEGIVMVQALVGEDGLVKDTRVVKSIPTLDAEAVACVRKWRFKPAMSHGKPIAVWVAVPVKFTNAPGK
jgi:TonB family protein